MGEKMPCPVCTLYLHPGMSLADHLETHPKEQVIKALVSLTSGSPATSNEKIQNSNEKPQQAEQPEQLLSEVNLHEKNQQQNYSQQTYPPGQRQLPIQHEANIPPSPISLQQSSPSSISFPLSPIPENSALQNVKSHPSNLQGQGILTGSGSTVVPSVSFMTPNHQNLMIVNRQSTMVYQAASSSIRGNQNIITQAVPITPQPALQLFGYTVPTSNNQPKLLPPPPSYGTAVNQLRSQNCNSTAIFNRQNQTYPELNNVYDTYSNPQRVQQQLFDLSISPRNQLQSTRAPLSRPLRTPSRPSSVLRYAESPVSAHYVERENGDFIVQESPRHIVELSENDNGEVSVIERLVKSPPSVVQFPNTIDEDDHPQLAEHSDDENDNDRIGEDLNEDFIDDEDGENDENIKENSYSQEAINLPNTGEEEEEVEQQYSQEEIGQNENLSKLKKRKTTPCIQVLSNVKLNTNESLDIIENIRASKNIEMQENVKQEIIDMDIEEPIACETMNKDENDSEIEENIKTEDQQPCTSATTSVIRLTSNGQSSGSTGKPTKMIAAVSSSSNTSPSKVNEENQLSSSNTGKEVPSRRPFKKAPKKLVVKFKNPPYQAKEDNNTSKRNEKSVDCRNCDDKAKPGTSSTLLFREIGKAIDLNKEDIPVEKITIKCNKENNLSSNNNINISSEIFDDAEELQIFKVHNCAQDNILSGVDATRKNDIQDNSQALINHFEIAEVKFIESTKEDDKAHKAQCSKMEDLKNNTKISDECILNEISGEFNENEKEISDLVVENCFKGDKESQPSSFAITEITLDLKDVNSAKEGSTIIDLPTSSKAGISEITKNYTNLTILRKTEPIITISSNSSNSNSNSNSNNTFPSTSLSISSSTSSSSSSSSLSFSRPSTSSFALQEQTDYQSSHSFNDYPLSFLYSNSMEKARLSPAIYTSADDRVWDQDQRFNNEQQQTQSQQNHLQNFGIDNERNSYIDLDACKKSSSVNGESGSLTANGLNICTDEKMPAKGEISEQESNGEIDISWSQPRFSNTFDNYVTRESGSVSNDGFFFSPQNLNCEVKPSISSLGLIIADYKQSQASLEEQADTEEREQQQQSSILQSPESSNQHVPQQKKLRRTQQQSIKSRRRCYQKPRVFQCDHCAQIFSKLKDRNAHLIEQHNYKRLNRRLIRTPPTSTITAPEEEERKPLQYLDGVDIQAEPLTGNEEESGVTADGALKEDKKDDIKPLSLIEPSSNTPKTKFDSIRTNVFRMLMSFNVNVLQQNGKSNLVDVDSKFIESRTFCCITCKRDFISIKSFDEHLGEHPAECFTCGKKFTRWTYFSIHLKRHLDWKDFPCTMCGKKFVIRSALMEHMRTHTGSTPLKCLLCDKRFKRYSNLTQHKKFCHQPRINKKKDYVCHCGEVLPSKARFIWHKETHDTKPKCCPYCRDRFIHSNSLRRHIRLAHSDKFFYSEPVKCPICSQVYAKSSLKAHMSTHSMDTQYECVICNKSFSTKWNLKVHNWVHANRAAKPYKCDKCIKAFVREVDYKNHLNAHKHIKPYTCEYCGCKFIRKYNYIRHRREHHGQKKFSCDLCGKLFHRHYYLIEHRRIHTGEKPYSCQHCGKSSTTKTNHNKHLKIHHSRDSFTSEA